MQRKQSNNTVPSICLGRNAVVNRLLPRVELRSLEVAASLRE